MYMCTPKVHVYAHVQGSACVCVLTYVYIYIYVTRCRQTSRSRIIYLDSKTKKRHETPGDSTLSWVAAGLVGVGACAWPDGDCSALFEVLLSYAPIYVRAHV